jgi:hypothetical protein
VTIQPPASSIQDRAAGPVRAARLLERLEAIWPRLSTGPGADPSWAGSRPLAVDEEHERVTVLARPGVLLVGHQGAFDRALAAATKRLLRHSEWQYPQLSPTVTAAQLIAALAAVPPGTPIGLQLWSHAELPEQVMTALLPARLETGNSKLAMGSAAAPNLQPPASSIQDQGPSIQDHAPSLPTAPISNS